MFECLKRQKITYSSLFPAFLLTFTLLLHNYWENAMYVKQLYFTLKLHKLYVNCIIILFSRKLC